MLLLCVCSSFVFYPFSFFVSSCLFVGLVVVDVFVVMFVFSCFCVVVCCVVVFAANSNRHIAPNSQFAVTSPPLSESIHVCIPHADGTHCVLWCARAPVRLRAWCDCAPTVVARVARVGRLYST